VYEIAARLNPGISSWRDLLAGLQISTDTAVITMMGPWHDATNVDGI
jgi:hypothetical protein